MVISKMREEVINTDGDFFDDMFQMEIDIAKKNGDQELLDYLLAEKKKREEDDTLGEEMYIPITKDGGFFLDDSSCAPYGDGVIRSKKQNGNRNDSKKKKSRKRK